MLIRKRLFNKILRTSLPNAALNSSKVRSVIKLFISTVKQDIILTLDERSYGVSKSTILISTCEIYRGDFYLFWDEVLLN